MTGRSRARDRSRPSGGAPLWTPARLSPLAWWRADSGVTLAGSKVAAWSSSGSLGVTLTQSTDAIRPIYTASGARGGRPCVEATSAGQVLTATSVTLPREIGIWVVTGTVTTYGILLSHYDGGARRHYVYTTGSAAYYVANSAGTFFARTAVPWTPAASSLLGVYDGSSIVAYDENIDAGGSLLGDTFGAENITGTLYAFSGNAELASVAQVYEMAIFPASVMTAENRAALQTYVTARYG